MALLASPYLHSGPVVVLNQTSQIINGAGQQVPLSEVTPKQLLFQCCSKICKILCNLCKVYKVFLPVSGVRQ